MGVTNEERADWALIAIEAFARATGQLKAKGQWNDDKAAVISDLLCDLMHYCTGGVESGDALEDFEKLLERARGNYEEELDEEEEDEDDEEDDEEDDDD